MDPLSFDGCSRRHVDAEVADRNPISHSLTIFIKIGKYFVASTHDNLVPKKRLDALNSNKLIRVQLTRETAAKLELASLFLADIDAEVRHVLVEGVI